jgi:hypothetical protein
MIVETQERFDELAGKYEYEAWMFRWCAEYRAKNEMRREK